jgi:hypothetical protein
VTTEISIVFAAALKEKERETVEFVISWNSPRAMCSGGGGGGV